MFTIWHRVGVVATIMLFGVCFLAVYLFSSSSTPSFESAWRFQNSSISKNESFSVTNNAMENVSMKGELHDVVVYRDAPWKSKIGKWLLDCHSKTKPIHVIEHISGKSCGNACSGQGVCNHELGECRCFHGFSGEGCSERRQLSCNYPESEELPYGDYVISMCSAQCDTTRAMCFCGEGTKYPNRPVSRKCGLLEKNWPIPDLDIFTTISSREGWCNVDPVEGYTSKVRFKKACDCNYDGWSGQFCEIPILSTCINQCSGHGYCGGGFCQCENGWYGIDCSVPSVVISIKQWPKWLQGAQINVPDDAKESRNLKVLVEKKRPLIYVYDLLSYFNSLLIQERQNKTHCVNRHYDDKNTTIWSDELYGGQMAMYESILASPYRTLNAEEADYFFVPMLDACIFERAHDTPHFSMPEHKRYRSSIVLEFYKKAYDHIKARYTYWNRSSGRDHIWPFVWDEGACYAPKEIWNSILLVHWGNTNSKHNHSTTAYWADSWDEITSEKRGNHTCFDPEKDIVFPAWKKPDETSLESKLWARPLEGRKTLFYFNGNLGAAYKKGRPEKEYSMGIRQKVAEEFGSSPNNKGKSGKQRAQDVIVTPLRSDNYHEELANSTFCGVMPGDGWSGRMEDSILQGCIPVIIQDGIFLPYENVFNYESLAIRIPEDEISNMINILRGINETEREFKLANIRKIWQRFLYRDTILLEAERQRSIHGFAEGWAQKISQLTEDDVFSTFIQILHFKLYNDPWRQQYLINPKKESGLPRECTP